MSKAVATQDQNAKTVEQIKAGALALAKTDEFGLSSNDIRIATLLLMQPASDMVANDKAKLGDIVNNESEKVIAGLNKPLEMIALYKHDTIRMYEAADGKFVREIPYNAAKPFDKEGLEKNQDGMDVAVRRYHTINFFVLLTEDVKSGEAFPVLVRFKSTSFQAGSKFASMLFKKRHFGKLPFDFTAVFSVEKRQNEKKQNWAALTFAEGRVTTDKEKEIAKQMIALINAKKYTVLEAEDAEPTGDAFAAAKPVVVSAEVVGSEAGEY